MSKMRIDKRGVWRTYTNKGNYPSMQWTNPGDPMNNHQARRGTKYRRNGHCDCEWCSMTRKEALKGDKVLNRELQKNLAGEE